MTSSTQDRLSEGLRALNFHSLELSHMQQDNIPSLEQPDVALPNPSLSYPERSIFDQVRLFLKDKLNLKHTFEANKVVNTYHITGRELKTLTDLLLNETYTANRSSLPLFVGILKVMDYFASAGLPVTDVYLCGTPLYTHLKEFMIHVLNSHCNNAIDPLAPIAGKLFCHPTSLCIRDDPFHALNIIFVIPSISDDAHFPSIQSLNCLRLQKLPISMTIDKGIEAIFGNPMSAFTFDPQQRRIYSHVSEAADSGLPLQIVIRSNTPFSGFCYANSKLCLTPLIEQCRKENLSANSSTEDLKRKMGRMPFEKNVPLTLSFLNAKGAFLKEIVDTASGIMRTGENTIPQIREWIQSIAYKLLGIIHEEFRLVIQDDADPYKPEICYESIRDTAINHFPAPKEEAIIAMMLVTLFEIIQEENSSQGISKRHILPDEWVDRLITAFLQEPCLITYASTYPTKPWSAIFNYLSSHHTQKDIRNLMLFMYLRGFQAACCVPSPGTALRAELTHNYWEQECINIAIDNLILPLRFSTFPSYHEISYCLESIPYDLVRSLPLPGPISSRLDPAFMATASLNPESLMDLAKTLSTSNSYSVRNLAIPFFLMGWRFMPENDRNRDCLALFDSWNGCVGKFRDAENCISTALELSNSEILRLPLQNLKTEYEQSSDSFADRVTDRTRLACATDPDQYIHSLAIRTLSREELKESLCAMPDSLLKRSLPLFLSKLDSSPESQSHNEVYTIAHDLMQKSSFNENSTEAMLDFVSKHLEDHYKKDPGSISTLLNVLARRPASVNADLLISRAHELNILPPEHPAQGPCEYHRLLARIAHNREPWGVLLDEYESLKQSLEVDAHLAKCLVTLRARLLSIAPERPTEADLDKAQLIFPINELTDNLRKALFQYNCAIHILSSKHPYKALALFEMKKIADRYKIPLDSAEWKQELQSLTKLRGEEPDSYPTVFFKKEPRNADESLLMKSLRKFDGSCDNYFKGCQYLTSIVKEKPYKNVSPEFLLSLMNVWIQKQGEHPFAESATGDNQRKIFMQLVVCLLNESFRKAYSPPQPLDLIRHLLLSSDSRTVNTALLLFTKYINGLEADYPYSKTEEELLSQIFCQYAGHYLTVDTASLQILSNQYKSGFFTYIDPNKLPAGIKDIYIEHFMTEQMFYGAESTIKPWIHVLKDRLMQTRQGKKEDYHYYVERIANLYIKLFSKMPLVDDFAREYGEMISFIKDLNITPLTKPGTAIPEEVERESIIADLLLTMRIRLFNCLHHIDYFVKDNRKVNFLFDYILQTMREMRRSYIPPPNTAEKNKLKIGQFLYYSSHYYQFFKAYCSDEWLNALKNELKEAVKNNCFYNYIEEVMAQLVMDSQYVLDWDSLEQKKQEMLKGMFQTFPRILLDKSGHEWAGSTFTYFILDILQKIQILILQLAPHVLGEWYQLLFPSINERRYGARSLPKYIFYSICEIISSNVHVLKREECFTPLIHETVKKLLAHTLNHFLEYMKSDISTESSADKMIHMTENEQRSSSYPGYYIYHLQLSKMIALNLLDDPYEWIEAGLKHMKGLSTCGDMAGTRIVDIYKKYYDAFTQANQPTVNKQGIHLWEIIHDQLSKLFFDDSGSVSPPQAEDMEAKVEKLQLFLFLCGMQKHIPKGITPRFKYYIQALNQWIDHLRKGMDEAPLLGIQDTLHQILAEVAKKDRYAENWKNVLRNSIGSTQTPLSIKTMIQQALVKQGQHESLAQLNNIILRKKKKRK